MYFRYDDLSLEYREQLVRDIGQYSVALLGISKQKAEEELDFCGCGTLVSASGSNYILTAAHVWEKKVANFDGIGLTLRENVDERFRIERESVAVDVIHRHRDQHGWDSWGPDLCFLKLPPSDVAKISAFKSFYNLTKRRDAMLSSSVDIAMGIWMLMGAPAVAGCFTKKHASLEYQGWFTGIREIHERDGFDFLDVEGDRSLPHSCGMSGGGLWQVMLNRSKSTQEFSVTEINLEGTAFFELDDASIRCHGRRSIYGNLPRPDDPRNK